MKPGVTVTVFSDNLRNHLHASDYTDFQVEFPDIPVTFITTGGIMHDRFIVLDYDEADERMFHCGASSKDAGIRLTTAITELTSGDVKTKTHELIEQIKMEPSAESAVICFIPQGPISSTNKPKEFLKNRIRGNERNLRYSCVRQE